VKIFLFDYLFVQNLLTTAVFGWYSASKALELFATAKDHKLIISRKMAMQPADRHPAIGTVISHANAILRNSFHDTPSPPREAHPTHTTDPTLQCVVDTGRPILLANRTVTAAPTYNQEFHVE